MDQKLFEQYFLDVKRWVKKSRELMISAYYLAAVWEKLYSTGKDVSNLCKGGLPRHPFEAWKSVGDSAALLIGLALENALKGHLIEKGYISINEKGKIVGLDGSHNILSMVQKSAYEATEAEAERLGLLTFQVQSLSKYHLAKDAKKQAEFTGRTDNPVNYYKLATKIILHIFAGELRELYLNSDGSYAHIPELPEFSEVPIKELLEKHGMD